MTGALIYLPAISRILLSSLFLWSGYLSLVNPGATESYIASVGVPAPGLALWVVVIVELGGGLAILLGIKARLAATVLAAWCLATAFFVHLVIALGSTSGAVSFDNMIHFYKNIVMAGGLLYVAAFGAGALSVDYGLSAGRDA